MENFVRVGMVVQEFAEKLKLDVVFDSGKSMQLVTPNINRVGLQLTGYLEYFTEERVQIIGPSEVHYLSGLTIEDRQSIILKLFEKGFPCIVFSRGLKVDEVFLMAAQRFGVPIFLSKQSTSALISDVVMFLKVALAQTKQIHAVLLDVNGVGVLIKGQSGIGKSEVALELVHRGHRLVADDIVAVKKVENSLIGTANKTVKDFMEIRGIGLVNIAKMYGIEAVKLSQEIELVIELEKWDNDKTYDRVGDSTEVENVMGVELPKLLIPVSPGRNIAVIVETAASVHRLKVMGYNAMNELTERMNEKK